MTKIGVFYATREGQTRKIAEHVAASLRARGLDAHLKNVRDREASTDLHGYAAAILAASVHIGRHEREMVRFVKEHRAELERIPTAFLSVTLSEAGVEQADATPEARAASEAGVQQVIGRFLEETGWYPARIKAVAGALRYTQYNPFVRFILKRIARSAGGSTDTSRDHEYTDWDALDRFVGELAGEISATAGVAVR
jgi:menaquinone-dependent protoporphyrinogen oxidase